jgi:hypothetical protein
MNVQHRTSNKNKSVLFFHIFHLQNWLLEAYNLSGLEWSPGGGHDTDRDITGDAEDAI